MGKRVRIVGRAKGVHRTFNEHELKVVERAVQKDKSFIGWDKVFGAPRKWDYVLFHWRNAEAKDARECLQGEVHADRVLWFTTGDPAKEAKESGLPYVLSADPVNDLRWDRVPKDFDGSSSELAELLVARTPERLAALVSLCQGYLAVHAERGTGEVEAYAWGPASIAAALQRMGWTGEGAEVLENSREDLRRRVREREWWVKPFAGVEPEMFLKLLRVEAPCMDAASRGTLEGFLRRCFTDGKDVTDVGEVARIYGVLCDSVSVGRSRPVRR